MPDPKVSSASMRVVSRSVDIHLAHHPEHNLRIVVLPESVVDTGDGLKHVNAVYSASLVAAGRGSPKPPPRSASGKTPTELANSIESQLVSLPGELYDAVIDEANKLR